MQLLVSFFFLMLFMPQVFQGPRAVLLLLVLLTTYKQYIPVHLSKEIKFYWNITYFVAIYSFFIGLLRGNLGALPCAKFYLVWPVLFLYFFIRCYKIDSIKVLLRTVVYGGLIVAAFNFILIANAFILHIGILDAIGTALGCLFNIQEGFAEYFSPSGNHLAYVLFFCVSLLLLKPETLGVKKKYLYICILLCVIDILLSNRRAMWLTVGMLPILLLAIFAILPYNKIVILRIGAITIISGLVIIGFLYNFLDPESVTTELLSSFDFSGDEGSNNERILQGRSLWNDFKNWPILGGGMGLVSTYVRTPEGPWAYELTYNYSLASVGLVGFIIYTISTCWIFKKSINLSKKSIEYASLLIPQILGLAAVLIISASNPYIGTFDVVWVIYLPVATINAIWYEQRETKKNLSLSESRA